MSAKWSKISLFFLLVVAIIGSSLRAIFFVTLPFDFGHLIHAHSHVAFQGWLYTILMLLLSRLFLTEQQIVSGRYSLQFKLTVFIIFGILVSFSLQGYGLYSITFSTLFQLMNYWFIYRFLKDVGSQSGVEPGLVSLRFVKTGLWLGLLSTLAPWGIGILSAKGLNGSEAYQSFIYFFLHFQYNGWFLFICLGLFFRLLEMDEIDFNYGYANRFYQLFTIAVVPALTLSFLGLSFRELIFVPAVLSAALQILGIYFFVLLLQPIIVPWLSRHSAWLRLFVLIFVSSLILKVALQLLSVFPSLQEYAFTNKHIILAYLHLSFIGVLTFLILAVLTRLGWLTISIWSKLGSTLLLLGFMTTQLMLVLQGMDLYFSNGILFGGSVLMAVGILALVTNPIRSRKSD